MLREALMVEEVQGWDVCSAPGLLFAYILYEMSGKCSLQGDYFEQITPNMGATFEIRIIQSNERSLRGLLE